MQRTVFFIFSTFAVGCLSSDPIEPVGIPGKCPDVEAVEGFDPTKMPGKWYSIYETGKEVSCVHYDFEQIGPTHYHGYFHHKKIEVSLNLKNLTNVAEGVIISSRYNPALDKVVLITFATDYVNYCGIFSCKEEGDVHFPHVAFWSRDHTLSDDKVQEMKDIIARYENLDISDLKPVNHNECSN